MRRLSRFVSTSVVAAWLLGTGCSSGNPNRGTGGTSGGGGGGVTGSGGSGARATATQSGGSGSPVTEGGGAGGTDTGARGGGGAVWVGGAAGGGPSGNAGGTGVAGTAGGSAGGGGVPGKGGGPGGAGGSGTVASSVVVGDDFVSGVKVAVHPNTNTLLVVTWTQLQVADQTLLEFSFAGSTVMRSRAQVGATGAHHDVVIGVPEKTAVTVRIVSKVGSVEYETKDYQGTTGALPSSFPKPQVLAYDAGAASPERWMLGAVEGSPGGCSDIFACYYMGPFWIYIMDRQGRIVWYWADMSDNASSAYPRMARDGEYLVIDKGRGGNTGVVKMTLDRQYYQFTAIADLDDAIDVTSDGSVLYDTNGELFELSKQGTRRSIWSCSKYFGPSFECYSNTVNWAPADDTVLLSFPGPCVVVQIDRKSGALIGLYGSVSGAYGFSPSPWKLQFPHSPTITPDGTFLVSTHLPDYPDETPAADYHHAFEEFTIDRTGKKLSQKWIYTEGPEWAHAKGFAMRLANGNTLANYGTGGVIREITPDKKTVFQVKFPAANSNANPYYNRMVGNNVYLDDLYALNGGGPQ